MSDKSNYSAILRDLEMLATARRIVIGGCGCCGSPRLDDAPEAPEAGFYRVNGPNGDFLQFIHPTDEYEWGKYGSEKPRAGYDPVVGASPYPEDTIEAVARSICASCEERPDDKGDARGNEFRWQDYRGAALATLAVVQQRDHAQAERLKGALKLVLGCIEDGDLQSARSVTQHALGLQGTEGESGE